MQTLLIECPWYRMETRHEVEALQPVSMDLLRKQGNQEQYLIGQRHLGLVNQ